MAERGLDEKFLLKEGKALIRLRVIKTRFVQDDDAPAAAAEDDAGATPVPEVCETSFGHPDFHGGCSHIPQKSLGLLGCVSSGCALRRVAKMQTSAPDVRKLCVADLCAASITSHQCPRCWPLWGCRECCVINVLLAGDANLGFKLQTRQIPAILGLRYSKVAPRRLSPLQITRVV